MNAGEQTSKSSHLSNGRGSRCGGMWHALPVGLSIALLRLSRILGSVMHLVSCKYFSNSTCCNTFLHFRGFRKVFVTAACTVLKALPFLDRVSDMIFRLC